MGSSFLLADSDCIGTVASLPVVEVAPLGAALYGEATDENWALLPRFPPPCLFLGHSFM